MELEEGLLALTEIDLSLEYNSERKTSISSVFLLYISSLPTLLPLSSLISPINSLSHHDNMSQYDF